MTNHSLNWKNIYLGQILINIAIGIYFIFIIDSNVDKSLQYIKLDSCCTIVLVFLFILEFISKRFPRKTLLLFTDWLSILALPYLFNYFLTEFFYSLADNYLFNQNTILIIAYILLYLIFLIPLIEVKFAKISNNFLRLFAVITLELNLYLTDRFTVNSLPAILKLINNSGIYISIMLLIVTTILIKRWYFPQCFNLKFIKSANFQTWVLILLLLFGTWFIFFVHFINLASSPAQIFWQWNSFLNSEVISIKWSDIFNSLYAGLAEEIERYLNLTLLLLIFRNSKQKVPLSILISTLIFALWHFTNLEISNRTIYSVILQVIAAFGFGAFLATLYLYTGKLWLTFIFHTIADIIAFAITNSYAQGLSMSAILTPTSACLIATAFPLLVTILMMFGKPRKVLDENADRIIG